MTTKPINLDARNAFARVPFPEYWGLDQTEIELSGCLTEAYDAVDHRNIADLLRAETDQSLRARTQTGYLVVSAEEYRHIPRSVEALSRSARNTATAAGQIASFGTRMGKSERAGAHILERKLPHMRNMHQQTSATLERARAFRAETANHWQAHVSEGRMRELAGGIFFGAPDLIEIAAEAHKWSPDDLENAKQAMVYRFVGGKRGKGGGKNFEAKKQYFSDMTGIIIAYNQAKINLLDDKIQLSEKVIEERLTTADRYA